MDTQPRSLKAVGGSEETGRSRAKARRKLHLEIPRQSRRKVRKRTAFLSVVREKIKHGKIQWPRLPVVPARGHEVISKRGALPHRKVRHRKAQFRSRSARQGSQTEAGGLRSPATRKAKGPPLLRHSRRPVPQPV